jgi:outer membrane scaffolding protein for murein synthesis (MipA/OmpV family)
MRCVLRSCLLISFAIGSLFASTSAASAGDAWWSGDWYVKLGATTFAAPRYRGDNDYLFQAKPLFSLGKAGNVVRFSARDDNPSMSLYDAGAIRVGATGKLVMPRNGDDSDDLKGLKPVKLGVELGAFAEAYPLDWMRLRAEVRHGIRSHQGIVADLSADAFTDVTPDIRISAGPRMTIASQDYMTAYYGVDADASKASGLKKYKPGAGLESLGLATEINWKATDKIEAGAFAEYKRLMAPAANSPLVEERGSRNQVLIGLSASYRFGFTIP